MRKVPSLATVLTAVLVGTVILAFSFLGAAGFASIEHLSDKHVTAIIVPGFIGLVVGMAFIAPKLKTKLERFSFSKLTGFTGPRVTRVSGAAIA